jgi:type IV pilus assembly protein PilY1
LSWLKVIGFIRSKRFDRGNIVMEKNIINRIASLWLLSALLLPVSALHAATGAEYTAIPPFVTEGAPPLVMLVMGRNHKLYYEAYNDASDLNDDGQLDIKYSPSTIEYYGYFDSYKCYEYSSADTRFDPSSTTTDKKCSGTDEWSGDFLNYLTMSRMDTMRKVLYGGFRSTDSTTETILQRVYVPQDAHSWGKEYASVAVDGYDIADYTPFAIPTADSGLRHLFASTTLSENGDPILRVALNNTHRIWQWVAKESPVADNSIATAAGGHPGHPSDHDDFEAMVNTYAKAAYQFGSGAWLDYSIRNHVGEKYPSPTAADFGAIDGYGNPWGSSGYNPHSYWATDQENYLAIFTGTLVVTTAGDYEIAVDGDDAVEVIIDGGTSDEQIIGYYGAHGWCQCTTHSKTVTLAAGNHTVEFRMEEAGGADRYHLYWNGPDSGGAWQIIPAASFTDLTLSTYKLATPASFITDYDVRVKVCDSAIGLESNCKQYPDGNYKPIGLLQRHGESKRMYFGLLTGSYENNTSGGVLRKPVGDISDEIDSDNGIFWSAAHVNSDASVSSNNNGIIQTINKLRIFGYDYGARNYNQNCGWITSGPMSNGQCRDWGNPIAEMMYETQRYFAGKKTPTSIFDYSGTTDDSSLGLPKPSWNDPYDLSDNGFESCAKPFMLVLSDINPTYDSDNLPGVDSNFGTGLTGDLPGLDVKTLADRISTSEGISGNKYIGQNGADSLFGACTEKDITGFGNIRGLCPEEPTKGGGYYSASIALYGHETDLQTSVDDDQKVTNYSIGLASPLPRIELNVGGTPITLVPFAKTVGSNGNSRVWNYWPTNTIVDFFVESLTPTSGTFSINYEDVEQGADHDMDDIVAYKYQLVDNSGVAVTDPANATAVDITLEAGYASGSYIQHAGYIISGTTADGTYLEVTDTDTAPASDFLVVLDTPPGAHPLDPTDTADQIIIAARDQTGSTHDTTLGVLPTTATRRFTPDSSGGATAAQLLKNPLWYAAKWGAFNDKDNDNTPNLQEEWDKDKDGIPDTYFYVSNPLRLEEQLNKSFADILNRASSGTAASVISNTRSGEGAIYQSVFFPSKTDSTVDGNTVSWVGQVHSFLVDSYGNMREDTWSNKRLDIIGPDLDGNTIVYHEDVNMNCVIDTEDINGNDVLDAGEDINGNGKIDSEDTNENGILDTEYAVCAAQSLVSNDAFLSSLDAIIVFNNGKADQYYDVNGNEQLDPQEILWNVGTTGIDTESLSYLWNSSDWLNDNSIDSVNQRSTYLSNNKERYIFTWVDNNSDDIVNSTELKDFIWPSTVPSVNDLDDSGEIYPYLHLFPSFADKPAAISALSSADFDTFLVQQTGRVMNYIRGLDDVDSHGLPNPLNISGSDVAGTEMRSRKYDGKTWRLGDIAYSTPTMVGRPSEGFHLLYRDESYADFALKYHNRRNVIYAGANDGMVHAFNGGFYDSFDKQFCQEINAGYNPYDGITTNDVACNGSSIMPELGSELWAYVPFNLLPQLYWLTETTYSHGYYVDQKPRIFDAKIFFQSDGITPLDSDHPNGWGTVMVIGMRFGGASIIADMDKKDSNVAVATDPTMNSAFMIFDITNPEVKPTLLAELTLPRMGFSTSYPTVVTLADGDHDTVFGDYNNASPESGENRWFLAFGSGPANSSGEPDKSLLSSARSSQPAQFYMLDLVQLVSNNSLQTLTDDGTGTIHGELTPGLHPYTTFDTNSFVSAPVSVDYDLDFNADVLYFGTVCHDSDANALTGCSQSTDAVGWGGKLRRIVIDDPNDLDEDQDPNNWVPDSVLLDARQPITAAASVAQDDSLEKRHWVFFGTGRYFVTDDNLDLSKQSFYGIKEPLDSASSKKDWSELSLTDLIDVTNYHVYTDQTVDMTPFLTSNTWTDLLSEQLTSNGWYLDFYANDGTSLEGERNLGQAALIGGLLSFTTFVPSDDICVASGNSYLWALYYKTGTAFHSAVLGSFSTTYDGDTVEEAYRKFDLGEGLATSPNIHIGRETGSAVFVQSSTGEITRIEEENPDNTKSGSISWKLR